MSLVKSLFICSSSFNKIVSIPLRKKSFGAWYRDLWIPTTVQPPYSHVTQIGDPVLRQAAEEVPTDVIPSKEVDLLVERMIQVLGKYDCVGLAAPQIGISLRIIVMQFKERNVKRIYSMAEYETRQMSEMPLTVFINPEMKVTNFNKKCFPEGCMSVRGYSGDVERFEEVSLSGVNQKGERIEHHLKGWNARIAQHEMDHLEGKIYTDKMDRSTFKCTCWEAVNERVGRVEIPFHK